MEKKSRGSSFIAPCVGGQGGKKEGQESEQKSVIGARTKTVSQNSSMGYHFKDNEHIFHMIP